MNFIKASTIVLAGVEIPVHDTLRVSKTNGLSNLLDVLTKLSKSSSGFPILPPPVTSTSLGILRLQAVRSMKSRWRPCATFFLAQHASNSRTSYKGRRELRRQEEILAPGDLVLLAEVASRVVAQSR